jgi:AcrR family transcriptional regulator
MSSSEFRAGTGRERRASSSMRARLLWGARVAVLRHGVDAAEIGEIAAAARVPRGAAYRCFPTRDLLLDALLDQAVGAGGATVEAAAGDARDPATAVAACVRQTVRLAERDPLLARLATRAGVAEALTDDFGDRVLRSLSRGVWVGRFPVASALLHLCAIRGAVLEVLRGRLHGLLPPAAADELAAAVLQMLGLPADEAAAIAARPLPELEPSWPSPYEPAGRGAPGSNLIALPPPSLVPHGPTRPA